MTLIDRYILRTVLGMTGLVVSVLLVLAALFTFIGEQGDVGQGRYTELSALTYAALNLPQQTWELLPIAALIGSLLGLGVLARGSELTVLRSSGVSAKTIPPIASRATARRPLFRNGRILCSRRSLRSCHCSRKAGRSACSISLPIHAGRAAGQFGLDWICLGVPAQLALLRFQLHELHGPLHGKANNPSLFIDVAVLVKLLIFAFVNRDQFLAGDAGVLSELDLLVINRVEPVNPRAKGSQENHRGQRDQGNQARLGIPAVEIDSGLEFDVLAIFCFEYRHWILLTPLSVVKCEALLQPWIAHGNQRLLTEVRPEGEPHRGSDCEQARGAQPVDA